MKRINILFNNNTYVATLREDVLRSIVVLVFLLEDIMFINSISIESSELFVACFFSLLYILFAIRIQLH
jgi:hypothetical protein